ncbi:hypothetical protein F4802DRAFT_556356 [Xylaria palmicola]|nr:hypothetical protein F4802DRAFT_556356 [Xylaria palmicola]
MVLLLVLILLSGIMLAFSVQQDRESVCDPQQNKLWQDDGFWALLSQMFLQFISIYCTIYLVFHTRRRSPWIMSFWFKALLTISSATSMLAAVVYCFSWKAATVFNFISTFVGVVSAVQLVADLDSQASKRDCSMH